MAFQISIPNTRKKVTFVGIKAAEEEYKKEA
jgi:hypothetical protein